MRRMRVIPPGLSQIFRPKQFGSEPSLRKQASLFFVLKDVALRPRVSLLGAGFLFKKATIPL